MKMLSRLWCGCCRSCSQMPTSLDNDWRADRVLKLQISKRYTKSGVPRTSDVSRQLDCGNKSFQSWRRGSTTGVCLRSRFVLLPWLSASVFVSSFILIVFTPCIFLCFTSCFCIPAFFCRPLILSPTVCLVVNPALDYSHLCSPALLYKWSLLGHCFFIAFVKVDSGMLSYVSSGSHHAFLLSFFVCSFL